MDIGPSYFTILSRLLAIKTTILFLLCLVVAIIPPANVEVEFPPPASYSVVERKIVNVPKYPSFREVGFLVIIYFSDIIFLYPFTYEGSATKNNIIIFLVGIAFLGLQIMAAVGWSGIQTSWLAAERKYGLWHSLAWSSYYMSFILTGVAIGLPLLYRAVWEVILFIIAVASTTWKALSYAYAPLIYSGR
jgi:hypothetical protein